MKQIFIAHGLKRSGNHAIINWLCAQEPLILFNDVININFIMRGDAFPVPAKDIHEFIQNKIPNKFTRLYRTLGRTPIITLEDHPLDISLFSPLDNINACNILILRDPRNLFASRIRKTKTVDYPCYSTDTADLQRVIDLWKTHAKEFLGLTNTLPNKVCIYYNAWFSNEQYRRQISQQLGFRFNDKGLNKVTHHGRGSSFDKTKFNGNAKNMNVLARDTQLIDDERIILENILLDTELVTLSQSIETNHCL